MAIRPAKTIRLNFWKTDPDLNAFIRVLGEPAEIRIGASSSKFISIRDEGITFSPGIGNKINIQTMPGSFKYGGMLGPLPFPANLIPSTIATPIPSMIFSPPLAALMSTIRVFAEFGAALAGKATGI